MNGTNHNLITAVALFFIGLPIGSFLNVVAYRLPRGQTPWKPARSHCPHCDAQIRERDNIPVLSWLILRGKCRDCGGPVSWRYPAFEGLAAILFAAVGAHSGFRAELIPNLLLVITLLIVTNTDLDLRIIPNNVLFFSLLAGVIAQTAVRPDDWLTWTISAAAAFTAMFLIALAYPRGMGMGDVKLAGVMGLYLGRSIAPGMLIAFALGTVVGIGVMAKKGMADGRKTAVPFAPFMAAGGVIALFTGESIIHWYLDTFTK